MVKRRRFPFGFEFGEDFEDLIEEMEKRMEESMKGFRDIDWENIKPGKNSFIQGFSIKIGPDGKPVISTFGNKPVIEEKKGERVISEEREPLVDIIEEKNNVKVVVELPGISKEDINLKCAEESINIKVDTPKRKYSKAVNLPCKVKPMSAKASYKNGVLEIALDRTEPKKEKGEGHKIKVD